MDLTLDSKDLKEYLALSSIINYDNEAIKELAEQLKKNRLNEVELIKAAYEYVRDNISHSADVDGQVVTCKASDVLKYKEGTCYAKSHLLAAILRYLRIPTGFCYQRLVVSEETDPYLILHGLNAVYISSINKWIRLDARGNKEGINAQFSLDIEKLAYKINTVLGEEDITIIYHEPDENVVECLQKYDKVEDLFNNLPQLLANS